MANRSRTSFQKRQRELLRADKQAQKIARRQARRLAPKEPESMDSTGAPPDGEDEDSADVVHGATEEADSVER